MLAPPQKEWLSVREAAKLLTEQSDFEVTEAYVRRHAPRENWEVWEVNQQMRLYSRKSLEGYHIQATRLKRKDSESQHRGTSPI